MAEDNHIDELLARYLQLLDSYTKLRSELSELQSSVYHSLARANFSAERGIRYGQNFYDERMQATKVVMTQYSADGLPAFDLLNLNTIPASETLETADMEEKLAQTKLDTEKEEGGADKPVNEEERDEASDLKPPKQPRSKDPLRWFGILSPPSLRQAQSSAPSLVETAVRLASIDAEMKGVEIEIRRARKRKAKNEKPAHTAEEVRGMKAGTETSTRGEVGGEAVV